MSYFMIKVEQMAWSKHSGWKWL